MGLRFGVLAGVFVVVYIAVGVLSFRISSDRGEAVGLGARTRERKEVGSGFSHYHEDPTPSRNLLEQQDIEQSARLSFFGYKVW